MLVQDKCAYYQATIYILCSIKFQIRGLNPNLRQGLSWQGIASPLWAPWHSWLTWIPQELQD